MNLNLRFAATSLIALLVGWFVYPYVVTIGMLQVSRWLPLPELLSSAGMTYSAIHRIVPVVDALAWIIFAIPTALILVLLKPRHLLWYTALATIPFFSWLVFSTNRLFVLPQEILLWLIAPSVAVALVSRVERWVRPNNSFKPRPLRGLGAGVMIEPSPMPRSGPA